MVADVQFEPMQVCHLDAVVHIEQQVFTNPWTRRDFEFSLERENAYCRVVEIEEVLIGYVIGFVIQKEFHLADFSVHPQLSTPWYWQQNDGCFV